METRNMKYISKACRQLDGEMLLRHDTQALLYRTLRDVTQLLNAEATDATRREDALRLLQALQDALGEHTGPLPTATELLGDPRRERLARNLLKG